MIQNNLSDCHSEAQPKNLDSAICEIIAAIDAGENVDSKWLDKFVRAKNREQHDSERIVAKRRLMPEYLRIKETLNVSEETDKKLTALLQAKPRRTASGVATITVLTKPWPCSGNCIFCPNDIRMPKSYMHNEPACQRAERWDFDPYMQVASRLHVLYDMGHNIDKIELIILGGTFTDYKPEYQNWFVKECFRACNEFDPHNAPELLEKREGVAPELSSDRERLQSARVGRRPQATGPQALHEVQSQIDAGEISYNEAWKLIYGNSENDFSRCQACTVKEVKEQHKVNENAGSRIVGLVAETRPDRASLEDLVHLRELGCTKVQIGIQTIDQEILDKNKRNTTVADIEETLKNMRLLGFKSHVHIMANLLGSMPDMDKKIYRELMTNEKYKPDEVKIYPCCLVESAQLTKFYESGEWKPYSEEELLDVVVSNIIDTPPYTRISRMIRDISTDDIIAGNKKPNLRQLVENRLREGNISAAEENFMMMPGMERKNVEIQEMRFREIANDEVVPEDLRLDDVVYQTNCTEEHFLQFVTNENRLCGFLRLSLPHENAFDFMSGMARKETDAFMSGMVRKETDAFMSGMQSNFEEMFNGAAMIREVHVYGKVAKIHEHVDSAQHLGLGTKLIERAFEIAKEKGYSKINVISSVGTREYYRTQGFVDNNLYQTHFF